MFYKIIILALSFEFFNAFPGSLFGQIESKSNILIPNEENDIFNQFYNPKPFPHLFYDFYNQNNLHLYNPISFESFDKKSDDFFGSFPSFPSFFQPQIVNFPSKQSVLSIPVFSPYLIQSPTMNINGEIITENLIGGVPFNCQERPSGHYQDDYFCDIFHACVHGQQKKTYLCPFVGEAQYFDQNTQKCEFIKENPFGCNKFFVYF